VNWSAHRLSRVGTQRAHGCSLFDSLGCTHRLRRISGRTMAEQAFRGGLARGDAKAALTRGRAPRRANGCGVASQPDQAGERPCRGNSVRCETLGVLRPVTPNRVAVGADPTGRVKRRAGCLTAASVVVSCAPGTGARRRCPLGDTERQRSERRGQGSSSCASPSRGAGGQRVAGSCPPTRVRRTFGRSWRQLTTPPPASGQGSANCTRPRRGTQTSAMTAQPVAAATAASR
jgi:hypothetical protein